MADATLLGGWVRRFLLEHLVTERNLARNTQRSYRDTLRLLLPYLAGAVRKDVDRLTVLDLSSERVRQFLGDVEEKRGCGVATRNQRLGALRSLAHFIAGHSPELVAWCGEIRTIPFKKAPQRPVGYLEKIEMDALLAAPDRSTDQGRRDFAVILFLYNTGSRADEAAQALIADIHLPSVPSRDSAWVLIRGKGNKERRCPLWERTVAELAPLIRGLSAGEHVFRNRRGAPLTRFGVHALVARYAVRAAVQVPSLGDKRVSPHTIRHTTATHLLRAGVDINTIRAWLGHVSLATTNVYAEVDLQMKAKALAGCEVGGTDSSKPWRDDAGLMEFLSKL
ncbi:MAG: site-specific integrase [Gemmataceae bacterium]|nr:site-specific integrase [Gemmataceae bacterium]